MSRQEYKCEPVDESFILHHVDSWPFHVEHRYTLKEESSKKLNETILLYLCIDSHFIIFEIKNLLFSYRKWKAGDYSFGDGTVRWTSHFARVGARHGS